MKFCSALLLLPGLAASLSAPARLGSSPLAASSKFEAPAPLSDSITHWLEVPLDYADASSASFKIRYHVDDSNFSATPEAPIMVSMGQEGTMASVRCNSDMVSNGAVCAQIEHRFYGSSVPSLSAGGGSNANQFLGLTVEAALADTAAVISALQRQYPVLDGAGGPVPGALRPVVVFGGSYSGATATWFRMSYPSSCAGAVSSSGVVNAIYDFVEFDGVVAEAISTPDASCAGTLRGIQEEIDARFSAGDGDAMKMLFNATNLLATEHGDADFMYMLADGYSMIDQYGGKAELCEGLAADPTVGGLKDVLLAHFGDDFGQDCYYDTECLSVENNPAEVGGLMGSQNSRSWRFQKCSQVAYLQARPGDAAALRSPLLTLQELEAQCEAVFGAAPARDGGNDELNKKFGADRPDLSPEYTATNVFSISYKDDPWKAASVTAKNGASLPYCYADCDGCGHCGAGVSEEDARICGDPQALFVRQVLAQARFQGSFADPNHPGAGRSVVVAVDAEEESVSLTGFDFAADGVTKEPWGPLPCVVDGVEIIADFSSKGGPADLQGEWSAVKNGIVWSDGNVWSKDGEEAEAKEGVLCGATFARLMADDCAEEDLCVYNDAGDSQCCTPGEMCIQGVGCRC